MKTTPEKVKRQLTMLNELGIDLKTTREVRIAYKALQWADEHPTTNAK